jgi:hypothetical protein
MQEPGITITRVTPHSVCVCVCVSPISLLMGRADRRFEGFPSATNSVLIKVKFN